MQISKAEPNLLSLNFQKKRTERKFSSIEMKYGNKAYVIHILTHHIYTHQLLSQSRKKIIKANYCTTQSYGVKATGKKGRNFKKNTNLFVTFSISVHAFLPPPPPPPPPPSFLNSTLNSKFYFIMKPSSLKKKTKRKANTVTKFKY